MHLAVKEKFVTGIQALRNKVNERRHRQLPAQQPQLSLTRNMTEEVVLHVGSFLPLRELVRMRIVDTAARQLANRELAKRLSVSGLSVNGLTFANPPAELTFHFRQELAKLDERSMRLGNIPKLSAKAKEARNINSDFKKLAPKLWQVERQYLETLAPEAQAAQVTANRDTFRQRLSRETYLPADHPLPPLGCNHPTPPLNQNWIFFDDYEVDRKLLEDFAGALGSSIGDVVWWLNGMSPEEKAGVIGCSLAANYRPTEALSA